MTQSPSRPRLQFDKEESGRLFRLLVESVTDYAIFMLDIEGHIMTWNAGAQRFKGYLPNEIIGKHFSVFYTEPDLKIRKPWYELEVAAEVGRFEDEGWRVRKDGTRFWANVIIIAIRDEQGTLLGYDAFHVYVLFAPRTKVSYELGFRHPYPIRASGKNADNRLELHMN